jgi:putative hemolysin
MFEAVIIVVLILINGVFSMSEIALISSRKARLQQKAKYGNKNAVIALELAKEPDRFLSTVQIGITLVSTLASAYGGSTITKALALEWSQSTIPLVAQQAENLSFVVVVGATTYLSLILGELVPKAIGLNNPEGIAVQFAPFMRVLSKITSPLVMFLSISTKLILKLLAIEPTEEPVMTEEELKLMIEQGSQHGIIEKKESELVKGVFRFGDRKANTLMTNRSDITWLDINSSEMEVRHVIFNSGYYMFPVCDRSLDKVLGVVYIRDIFKQFIELEEIILEELVKQPLYVHMNMPALQLLENFRKNRNYVAMILNEYGEIQGLATLHNIIESIFGEMPAFHENDEVKAVKREDGSWLVDGDIKIDELKEILNFHRFNNEYATLGGFMMYQLERLPKEADFVDFGEYRFEIMDMDANKVDKVLIAQLGSKKKGESGEKDQDKD